MPDNNWKAQEKSRQQERELADVLDHLTDELGYPPTREEMAAAMGLSVHTIARIINRMKSVGLLIENGPRTLRFPL